MLPRLLPLLLPLVALPAGSAAGTAARPDNVVIKCGTVAPDGTTAMNYFEKMNKELFRKTRGRVTFKFFSGGIAGEEKTMLEKIRYDQLQAGGFTGMGLGEILPEVRILELPYFIDTYAEYDYVLEHLAPEFDRRFAEKGYIVLGWGEGGFAHLFSRQSIRSRDDLKKAKVWLRTGDPMNQIAMDVMGIQPVPLALSDVLTSLQTGLIDTVYVSPYYLIGLQWFPYVTYCADVPLFNIEGALLVKKETFEQISSADQATLREVCAKYMRGLVEETRRENREARQVLQEKGVQFLTPGPEYERELTDIKNRVADALTGKLFDRQLRDRVEALVAEHRARATTNQ